MPRPLAFKQSFDWLSIPKLSVIALLFHDFSVMFLLIDEYGLRPFVIAI